MPQLFTKSNDAFFRLVLAGGVLMVVVTVTVMLTLARTTYMTGQDRVLEQSVPFSHQHHVSDIGIDCRYCHQGVETSPVAGVPATDVCIKCHKKLWNQSDMLRPVRVSFRDNKPLRWNRVHDLPDYVFFNHSIHIKKGVGCYSCHGRIGQMPLVRQARPLTMQWCLDCHRDPQTHVRPHRFVFDPQPLAELLGEDQAGPDQIGKIRREVAKRNNVQSRVTCYTCHR